MKKIKTAIVFGVALLSATILGFPSPSEASISEPSEHSSEEIGFLEEFNDNDSLIALPNGGFLHGQATITDEKTKKVVGYYDSETDSNATTVKIVKEIVNQETIDDSIFTISNILPRGTKPATQVVSLGLNSFYSSSKFSGSGWRFAGYLFKTQGTLGTRLLYTSHVSTGFGGTTAQATATYNSGDPSGIQLSPGDSRYVDKTSTYYVKNPKSGTYYYVINS